MLRIRAIGLFAVLLAASTVAAVSAAAQAPAPPPDSTRSLSAARSAQARFESLRRSHLPWTGPGGSGGDCEERIGRFRLWSNGESKWEPPPEAPRVQQARLELIARLDAAATDFPGDEWVVGQRVRYQLEAEQKQEALAAARACRAPRRWWCLALEGFVLHRMGEFAAADSVFAQALAAMPEKERRRWNDLSVLLDHGELRSYRRLSPAQRAAFEERFWWMAKPLYLLPGNDARSEHYSRHVIDRLQDRSKSPENLAWGSDLREILLRYGAPVAWQRIRPRHPGAQSDGRVTHYARGSRSFYPRGRFVADPAALTQAQWELEPRCARAGYAPAYSTAFAELEHQVAVFTRGDSAVVVAAFDLAADTLFTGVEQLEVGLFLLRDESSEPVSVRRTINGTAATFRLVTVPGPLLMSLEVHAPTERRAARARYGMNAAAVPEHGLSMSDLILLEATDSLPGTLAEALAAARGSLRLPVGARFNLFWELYGVRPGEPFSLSIVMVQENRGFLRRLGERIGVVREVHPVRVRWQEAAVTEGDILSRALELEVPEVSPGPYRIELTVTFPGREPLTASRAVWITG